ncbi:CDP-6-deoxy-delta-3,4-glucoseen reductase [Amphibiibacter pelophylacis]|uniref:CDP-6-deoxy-delta-3,4-glucoseen reductase n=1 Tax=Amphibiibacter pelophylacis TaxID=1799477 RepID=A0ACC6P4H1_9BURK
MFRIEVQPAGLTFESAPEDTLLHSAQLARVGLPYGCQDGACGSCKCKVLSGQVEQGPHQSSALSAQEEAEGWILSCTSRARSDVVLEARIVAGLADYPVSKMPVRVQALERLADDVMRVRLQLPATSPFRFRAGQYVDVLLRNGDRRSYSMASAPHDLGEPAAVDFHIRHLPGGAFTDHVFGAMKERQIQRIEGPLGTFFLRDDSSKPMIFLGSGTGFAPLKAMLDDWAHKAQTAEAGAPAQRPVTLYWGGRRLSDLYMHDWCEQFAANNPLMRYVPVLSDSAPEGWKGRTGFVHHAVMADFPDLSAHEVYACGVPIMVDSARADFTAKCGLPADAFYADSFVSEADKAKG